MVVDVYRGMVTDDLCFHRLSILYAVFACII
jgi:hypothetical protein